MGFYILSQPTPPEPTGKTWTCRRQSGGELCRTINPGRKRLCVSCGKPRPPKRRPAHMAALNESYEFFIEINGGEHCGICGRKPSGRRKLDRDHDHNGQGAPRGLLCALCNRTLARHVDARWLRKAAVYLEKHADRMRQQAQEEAA